MVQSCCSSHHIEELNNLYTKLPNRFDHPNILAGQGTTGLEILEQVPDVDAVVIPTGGGGLLAGCAVALKTMKPSIKIIVSILL